MSKSTSYTYAKVEPATYGYPSSSKSSKPGTFSSSKSASHATPKPSDMKSQLPPGTAFLFRIDQLLPNWEVHTPTFTQHGHWDPPSHWNAYRRIPGNLYRWRDGRVTVLPTETSLGEPYSCATLFTQYPWTQHFLVAEYDAERRNVSEYGGWHSLGFNHVPHPVNDSEYSELDLANRCSEHHLVAPVEAGRPSWVNDLFTAQYKYNAQADVYPPQESAGLIGKLSLLLGLVAFSRPAMHIHTVLTDHVRLGQWIPLASNEHGRIQHRGMVVTVWLDPTSAATAAVLGAIEMGSYGAFFR